ncbi:MAG: S8 family serine peptidase, partial [Pseudomonadota bacterium]
ARQTGGLAPLRMVMPAGNDNLAQTQAQISLPRSDAESLSWRLPPGDYSVSYLEIWMPNFLSKEALFGVAPHLRLTLPDGTQIDPPPLAVGQQVNLLSADGGDVVGRLFCDLQDRQDSSDTSSGRVRLLLALNPTAARDPQTPTIPAGAWALDLSLTTKMPDAVHVTLDLCIQRDDTLGIGPDRGVPSYFEAPGYRVFDDAGRVIDTDGERDLSPSAVRRRGTLNARATSVTTCRVGAYRAQDGRMAPYSSSGFGPMHHAAMSQLLVDGPHVSAAGDHSLALGGVMAAGTRSGSVVSLSGTSMASAQIAREVAKALKGRHPTRDPESNLGTPGAIENIAQVAIRERRFSTPALKPDKTGAGRVPFTPLPGYKDRGGL